MLSCCTAQWIPCARRRNCRLQPYKTLLLSNRQVQKAPSSSSSRRWQLRQQYDVYAREARTRGLKSRAAFKLLELDRRYSIFTKGQTVIDLGFAPGSWSQVAIDRIGRSGRVIGIDIIPAQPPKGVSAIQGNFLSTTVQAEVRRYLQGGNTGRSRESKSFMPTKEQGRTITSQDLDEASKAYFEFKKNKAEENFLLNNMNFSESFCSSKGDYKTDETVDVVLSDMSAPWEQPLRSSANSLVNPYFRMMNTSGNLFRDHIGSMNLCNAALDFALQTVKVGGSLICKFYQGVEDKSFERRLKKSFTKVYRDKPISSRNESKEAFFVALKRKAEVRYILP